MTALSLPRFIRPFGAFRFPVLTPLILFGSVFALGLWIGLSWKEREYMRIGRQAAVHLLMMPKLSVENGRPGMEIQRQAWLLDSVVTQWVERERKEGRSPWTQLAMNLTRYSFQRDQDRQFARQAAEFRLKYYSGDAPNWQVTKHICDEHRALMGNGGGKWGLSPGTVEAYAKVLGRRVTEAELLPRIPGGICK